MSLICPCLVFLLVFEFYRISKHSDLDFQKFKLRTERVYLLHPRKFTYWHELKISDLLFRYLNKYMRVWQLFDIRYRYKFMSYCSFLMKFLDGVGCMKVGMPLYFWDRSSSNVWAYYLGVLLHISVYVTACLYARHAYSMDTSWYLFPCSSKA
jgi:hypothetical protein